MELSDTQLTFLSTLAWLVLTSIGFTILVRWSTSDSSWTVLPGLVRGVRGWVDDRESTAGPSHDARWPEGANSRRPSGTDPDTQAEIIDL